MPHCRAMRSGQSSMFSMRTSTHEGSLRLLVSAASRYDDPQRSRGPEAHPADAPVEDLHRVHQRQVLAEVLADLQQAAGVRGDEDVGARAADVVGLAPSEVARR